jgi:uncharacterized membrane protein HdeD (DUF308 family)
MENMILPGIVVVCGVIIQAVKLVVDEKHYKWLPVISCTLGAILGVTAMVIIPNQPQDIYNALLSGIVSGAAATGIHQVQKQINSK